VISDFGFGNLDILIEFWPYFLLVKRGFMKRLLANCNHFTRL
jgi:hypothetical protein